MQNIKTGVSAVSELDYSYYSTLHHKQWCSFWLLRPGGYYFINNIYRLAKLWVDLCQTHECCECIIANIWKCSLSFLYWHPFSVVASRRASWIPPAAFQPFLHPIIENSQKSAFLEKLILRKIIKITATKCHIILKLKCTKFDFGWGSVLDPTRGAYCAPSDSLAGFKGAYI